MRRRHKTDDAGGPVCKQKPGHTALEFTDDWRRVTCYQCQVRRFLHSRRAYDQRKAREAERLARPVPLLEETVEPEDKTMLHEALAMRNEDKTMLHEALAMRNAGEDRAKLEDFETKVNTTKPPRPVPSTEPPPLRNYLLEEKYAT